MFDSGFGGLTVARAVIILLPAEDVVYLGDTGRYPYGSKPLADVKAHSIEIADYLVDTFDIKLLVVACNTATAAALRTLSAHLDVPVIGVIQPGVRASSDAVAAIAADTGRVGRLGVIGTVGTVSSGAYERSVARHAALIGAPIEVVTCACPGFVEFVERGDIDSVEVRILAERLLAPIVEANVDALLLGCTHYPYLARTIGDVVGHHVVLVSSADETAFALADRLRIDDLGHPDRGRVGEHQFISSGDVRAFTLLGSRLLGPELVNAERWDPPHAT